ncbi:hypothetical protein [Halobacillus aidingensis]|uniref:Uncharacterized protein n=1 Tax=Halobacillus aidingensis TaxID=240303 RepID=A0A1H0FPC5_HALAD|nr:hypothetical protein [Halobacillus aidingensis]SDN96526.1 hypothetical protein SAMN05421677_10271 [Halobacillus aidingensis]
MKSIIPFLFGHPYRKSKLMTLYYWMAVWMYIIAAVFLLTAAILTGDGEFWLSFIMVLVMFPIMFRLVYGVVTRITQAIFNHEKKQQLSDSCCFY